MSTSWEWGYKYHGNIALSGHADAVVIYTADNIIKRESVLLKSVDGTLKQQQTIRSGVDNATLAYRSLSQWHGIVWLVPHALVMMGTNTTELMNSIFHTLTVDHIHFMQHPSNSIKHEGF